MFGKAVTHFVHVTSKLWPVSPPPSASATCAPSEEGTVTKAGSSMSARIIHQRLIDRFFLLRVSRAWFFKFFMTVLLIVDIRTFLPLPYRDVQHDERAFRR